MSAELSVTPVRRLADVCAYWVSSDVPPLRSDEVVLRTEHKVPAIDDLLERVSAHPLRAGAQHAQDGPDLS